MGCRTGGYTRRIFEEVTIEGSAKDHFHGAVHCLGRTGNGGRQWFLKNGGCCQEMQG